ncbi:MAG: ABC transporter permease [Dehalococcoidia bacterium]
MGDRSDEADLREELYLADPRAKRDSGPMISGGSGADVASRRAAAGPAARSSFDPLRRLLARPHRRLWGYLLLAPACVLVLGLIVYPMLYTVALAFTDGHDFNGPGSFNGIANFRALFDDPYFWPAVRNTLVLTSLTVVLELVLGVATAMLLWWRFWGRSLFFLIVFVPWVFPAAFSSFAWFILFKPPFHTFYTLEAVRLKDSLESLLGPSAWYFTTVLTFNVWRTSSFVAVFMLAGLNGIPRGLLEFGRLESRSSLQQFRLVILPLVRRFIVLAVLTSLVITFMDYTIVYLQTGGLIFQPLLGTRAYITGIVEGDTGLSAAYTVIQFPVIAVLLYAAFRAFDREPSPHVVEQTLPDLALPAVSAASAGAAQANATASVRLLRLMRTTAPSQGDDRPRSQPAKAGRGFRLPRRLLLVGGGLLALLLAVFHILPIYWTLIQAVRPLVENTDGNPFWVRHPSLTGFTQPLSDRAFWTWMQNTALVFGAALIVAIAASLLAGYALARLSLPGHRWIARLLLASYFVPPTAVLVPVYQVFIWLNISDSFLAVILLYQTLTIPFCAWLFYTFYCTLPADTEEAALLDGSRLQTFLRMTLRMSWPMMITAFVFCVGMMASDLLYAGTFLIGHNQQTVTVGLAIVSLDLGEFSQATGAIGIAALPIVLVCLIFAPAFVRGLTLAMEEGA